MNTGKIIKQKRQEKNLTQAQLAQIVSVSEPMICQIERGTKIVSLPLAKELSEALECNINELM